MPPAIDKHRPRPWRMYRDYDDDGNLTVMIDRGDVEPEDDLAYAISYQQIADAETGGRFPRAHLITVTHDGAGASLLRQGQASYGSRGQMKTLTDYIFGGPQPLSGAPRPFDPDTLHNPTWTFLYHADGNLSGATNPDGHSFFYDYDPDTHTHLELINDTTFNYSSTRKHDLRFGTVTEIVDANGQRQTFTYDDFGRLTEVRGPLDLASNVPTIKYDYAIANSTTTAFQPPFWARAATRTRIGPTRWTRLCSSTASVA